MCGRPVSLASGIAVTMIHPFTEFGFMRRALVATLAMSLGSAPLGCFLVLRRMSLVGDAMAHALLPGAAIGFVIAGFSLVAMSLGGFIAALGVALLANGVTRYTSQRGDASFAAFYLIALALGVLLLSLHGTSVDLMHILFGSILAVDDASLMLIVAVTCVSLVVLTVVYRPLVVDSFDARFLKAVGGHGGAVQALLLVLVVANLVTGFQALGTLMAVGLMMLPAAAARFWTDDLTAMIGVGRVDGDVLGLRRSPVVVPWPMAFGSGDRPRRRTPLYRLSDCRPPGRIDRRMRRCRAWPSASAAVITRRALLGCSAAWALLAAALSRGETRGFNVVASFSILADLVRQVGGPGVHVEALVGPDADAHLFEPKPADARSLANADLIVINGLGFEGWMVRLIRASGTTAKPVVASAGLLPRTLAGQADPHAWQDLSNGARYVRNIVSILAAAYPSSARECETRGAAYLTLIDALDRRIRSRFDVIPRSRRRVMTSHDAFGYFGAAYGIDFIAPLGMSTDGEPSASTVARLVRQVRNQDIRAVFIENITDPRLVERIAHEAGIATGGRLYSDSLSAPGTEADTYLKLVAHNASVIAASLEAVP